MRRKILMMVAVLLLTVATATLASANAPDIQTAWWWWGSAAGSSTVNRTTKQLSGTYGSSLAKAPADANGMTVTLWLVVFNNPEACATAPCTGDDLYNPAVAPDVLASGGQVVGESERVRITFRRRAGSNAGSIAALFEMPLNDGQPFGLIDPQKAEVHLVLRTHGPMVPEMMPAQISTYEGGCVDFAPFGYPPPTGPHDLFMGVGQCQDVQFSIHQ